MPPPIPLVTRIKAQLKLAIARLRMVQKRDESTSKAARRSMAQLLEAGKSDSARIRVENIIRSDIQTELYEILELYCELLLARAGLLESSAVCDPGLEEAAKSIIYAAPKTEIKELQAVRILLAEKFGREFVLVAMDNSDGKVSEKVVRKLMVTPPKEALVQGYLEEIAKAYGVDWPAGRLQTEARAEVPAGEILNEGGEGGDEDSNDGTKDPVAAKTASTKPSAATIPSKDKSVTGATSSGAPPTSPLTVTPPRMTTDNVHPKITLNSQELKPSQKTETAAAAKKRATPGNDGLEDLELRFAALKKLAP